MNTNESEKNTPIENVEDQIKILKKKKATLLKEMKYKSKQSYRRERAHRLIQTGALAEKYFQLDELTIDEREELFKMFADFVVANKPKKFKKK